MKKNLVLGATGAMGKYLVPLLASQGYLIDAVSLDKALYDFPNVNNIQAYFSAYDQEAQYDDCCGSSNVLFFSDAE